MAEASDDRAALDEPSPTDDRLPLSDVYAEHFAYVLRSLLRLGVPRRDAEDLAQDVFVVVHRRLSTYDRARPLKPWLFGIVYNVVRDHRRRARVRLEDLGTPPDAGTADPGYRALEAADVVYLALREVPEARRVVFVMYEMDHVPMKEVAALLQTPVDTCYARLRKARIEFRDAVRRLEGFA